jgi:hypothetical protein
VRWVLVPPAYRWLVLVVGNLNLYAVSIRDRDIFNQEFETEWKCIWKRFLMKNRATWLRRSPSPACSNRVQRATRVYEPEMARHRLQP